MLRKKIIYLVILIISVVFFILYTEPFSLYLLILIAAIPVIMGICIILARLLIDVKIETDSDTAIKNEKINVRVSIRNRTPFPFANSVVTLKYRNNLVDIPDYISVSIPIHGFCSEYINFSILSEHCGIISIKTESIRIYDFIKLFSCRIRSDKVHEITVLPELYPLTSVRSFNMINSDESDYFSKSKSGDDPSEIFDLKDYVPGDKPNRIHWNLSLKQDELIVRHYSQPISTSVLLMIDFRGKPDIDADVLDTAAEAAFSIAFFFTESGIPFSLGYYSREMNKVMIAGISDQRDTAMVIKRILYEGPLKKTYFSDRIKEIIYNYSNVFYITASADNIREINENNFPENFRPVFIDKGDNPACGLEQDKEIIVIPAGKTAQFISDILI